MSDYIAGYLIIFIPLISAIICFLAPFRFNFLIFIAAILSIALTILKITPDLLLNGKLSNEIGFNLVSIATEYHFDILSVFFLFLIIFNKLMINIYYQDDIKNAISKEVRKLFYSLSLLNLFGLIGIFTTNNLINLFVYIEIYSLTFYAIMSMSGQADLTKLAFRYFSEGIVGSILILISFLSLYIITEHLRINLIINDINYLLSSNYKIAYLLFFGTILGIIIKFFPIWLYFEKIKQNSFIANFLSTSSLFIKANVGIYLLIKILYFLFGAEFSFNKLHFHLVLFIIGSLLIAYNVVQILKTGHLKIITSYLCLINLGFILIGIGIGNKESIAASFLYIVNYSLINLMAFLFASYLSRHFSDCNIKHLDALRRNNFIAGIPLKVIILFISGLPMTVFFLANWNMAYSVMNLNLTLFVLVLLAITYFSLIKLIIKMVNHFYFETAEEEQGDEEESKKPLKKNFIYSASFWIMISIALYFAIFANILSGISNSLSIYLLSNTI